MKLTYDIHEKPKFGQNLVFALQQLLAIIAATLLVPTLVNGGNGGALYMDPPAALFGAGVGTLCYILITRRCPVGLLIQATNTSLEFLLDQLQLDATHQDMH